jgi:hypothetical protein
MTRLGFILLPVILLAGGCAVAGPASITRGRSVYNEVINHTEDEQVLSMIVRQRYDQTFGMLTVASVTANIKVAASASSDFRAWGEAVEVDGNLVPLSLGVAYEENPTISYVPLGGEAFLRRMLAPMTLEHAILLLSASVDDRLWMHELFASVNGLRNPLGRPPSPEFTQAIDALIDLSELGLTSLGRDASSTDAGHYVLSIHGYGDAHADEVRAYLEMLGLDRVTADGQEIVIPVRWATGRRTGNAIHFEMRSAFDVIRRAASMVEVPADHLEAGIVEPVNTAVREHNRFITIRSSQTRPPNAAVAVPLHDAWFYIDGTDARSKRSFSLMRLLIGIRMEDTSVRKQLPILTVPVS